MMAGRNVEQPGGQGRLSHDGLDAPKGRKIIAQGISPGLNCFAPSGQDLIVSLASEAVPRSFSFPFHSEKTITAF